MKCCITNVWLSCLIAASIALVGCGEAPAPKQEVAKAEHAPHADHKDGDEHKDEKKAHTHDGWWCDEHGVPEEECAQCNSKVAADFKKKGDWCKKDHDRPDSQCFICHPEKLEEYAAKYEAKLGKKPPKPELN